MSSSFVPDTSLAGKVAIVTGSTRGIGADIARVLAACGANVVVLGLEHDSGAALVAELGATAMFSVTDVQQDDDIDACVGKVLARFGRIDILVNNACSYNDNGLASTRAQWHQTLGVNLVSAAIFAQKVVPHMGSGGVIVNLGSTGGKFGAAGRALYPASKAALLQLTKNLAVDLAANGIRVLAVSPAWTWSPAIEQLSRGSRADADAVAAPFHPLGRVGDGREIGNVIAFLASPAAAWMTGVDIPVDGGFSILGPDRGIAPRAWFGQHIDP